MLSEILNNLKPYVVGIKFADDIAIIEYKPDKKWEFITDNRFDWNEYPDNPETFIVYAVVPEISLDDLIEYISSVIKFNKENEAKQTLLETKIQELRDLFKTLPVDECETLEFKTKKKRPRGRPKKSNPGDTTDSTSESDNQRKESLQTPEESDPENGELINPEKELVVSNNTINFLDTQNV